MQTMPEREEVVMRPPIMRTHKVCSACHRDLPLDEFNRDRYSRDGCVHKCKECCKTINSGLKPMRIEKIIDMVNDDTNDAYEDY